MIDVQEALCAVFVFAALPTAAQITDTTTSRTIDLKASLAASYTTSRNWSATDFQNIAFSGSVFLQDVGQRATRRHQHQLLADLSYLRFIDSTWAKGVDRFVVTMCWSRTADRWTRSWSTALHTQFLPNEALDYDPLTERMRTVRYGGWMAPGGIQLGYGATWYPWTGSSIQLNCATVDLTCTPRRSLQDTAVQHMAYTRNTVIDMRYGASVLININHPLNDHVDWINSSRVFCNAFDRDHLAFDAMNRLAIKLWKYLQLRFDTHLGYDPQVSYDLRFSQEVLLGIFYEARKAH